MWKYRVAFENMDTKSSIQYETLKELHEIFQKGINMCVPCERMSDIKFYKLKGKYVDKLIGLLDLREHMIILIK